MPRIVGKTPRQNMAGNGEECDHRVYCDQYGRG